MDDDMLAWRHDLSRSSDTDDVFWALHPDGRLVTRDVPKGARRCAIVNDDVVTGISWVSPGNLPEHDGLLVDINGLEVLPGDHFDRLTLSFARGEAVIVGPDLIPLPPPDPVNLRALAALCFASGIFVVLVIVLLLHLFT